MADRYLIVPVQLEALQLTTPQSVMSAAADFSRLPWSDGKADFYASTPYTGSAVAAQPFQNESLNLSSGLHLHWLLPRALRTSAAGQGKIAFPAAPNRWLVTRTVGQSVTQWIVESDYLSPVTTTFNMDAVTVPVSTPDINANRSQPFMYLGRQVPLAEWLSEQKESTSPNLYWKKVQGQPFTALGYGELAFSTFYPNCRSVFGFFDHEAPAAASYEVLGWYSDRNDDVLNGITTADELSQRLKWHSSSGSCPDQSLYYGIIDTTGTVSANAPEFNEVAVGNSGSEALSAYLASTLNPEQKSQTEDQLEAILLEGKIPAGNPDAGARFNEARHLKGFDVEDAGIIWTLKKRRLSGVENNKVSPVDDSLPADIASQLDQLNRAQEQYNQLSQSLNTQSVQLYSDWYRYMMCCYPPAGDKADLPNADALKRFIELTSLPRVRQFQQALGQLLISNSNDQITVSADGAASKAATVASQFNSLVQALTPLNSALKSSGYQYDVSHVPAPRYYAPSDPVVLFACDKLNAPDCGDQSEQSLTFPDSDSITAATSGLPFNPEQLRPLTSQPDFIDLFRSSEGKWRPQTLEWLVSFFPVNPLSNVGSADGLYQPEFITQNFSLNEGQADFTQQQNTARVACEYKGKTYVTASTSERVAEALKNFILKRYPKLDEKQFSLSLKSVWLTYPDEKQDYSNPGYTAVQAYQKLAEKLILTQSIGGFHLALLQHINGLTLPVADPLGFSGYKQFTTNVANTLQGNYTATPNPDSLFMPLRCGALSFLNLTLADHFGRISKARVDSIIASTPMQFGTSTSLCWLSPRLSQPARLNFRWLSAETLQDGDETEMNTHPTTNPVCGWLVADYLDNSIVCYSQQGRNLGSFNQQGDWQPTPGDEQPVTADDLTSSNPAALNASLLSLLLHIKQTAAANKAYISDLIASFQGAQQNIYPENYAGHSALSLLMGKPIAVVRARVNLEIKGGLFQDQGWVSLIASMQTGLPITDSYQNVRFPLRLGEYRQLDDGLIGYWIESATGITDGTLFINDSKAAGYDMESLTKSLNGQYHGIPGATLMTFLQQKQGWVKREDFVLQYPSGGKIFDQLVADSVLTVVTHADSAIDYYADAGLIEQTLDAEPVTVTMLMDPHGSVHLTSGILPVKSISLPQEYYTSILSRLSVNFFTAPLLTPPDPLRISLPEEPARSWSWLQKHSDGWQRTPDISIVRQSVFASAWEAFIAKQNSATALPAGTPWNELLSCQWLIPVSGSRTLFAITGSTSPARKPLQDWQSFTESLDALISDISEGIKPFTRNADFFPQQQILEGWIELTQQN